MCLLFRAYYHKGHQCFGNVRVSIVLLIVTISICSLTDTYETLYCFLFIYNGFSTIETIKTLMDYKCK